MKFLIFSSLVFLGILTTTPHPQTISSEKEKLPDSTDILPEVLKINGDARFAPPLTFRQGIVSPATYDNYLTKTEDGFIVQLPAVNNVPTPVWHDGSIYVSGGFGSKQYYRFNAETGTLQWAVDLDDDGPSSAVITDSVIIFNTESCTLFACNLFTGEQLWSWYLGDPLMSSPTVAGNLVFTSYPNYPGGITGYENNYDDMNNSTQNYTASVADSEFTSLAAKYSHILAAFDVHSGKVKWQKRIDGDVLSAPVVKDNELHVVTLTGSYFVFDSETGNIQSAKSCRATSAPVFLAGKAYMSTRADRSGENVSEQLTGWDLSNMQIEQQYNKKEAPYLDKTVQEHSELKAGATADDAANGFSSVPATSGYAKANENIGQGNVSTLQAFYGSRILNFDARQYSTMGEELICVDPETGKNNWTYKLDGNLSESGGYLGTSPIIAGEYIIVATLNGNILLIDHATGKEIKRYDVKESVRSQPIAMNGWIYVTTTNGKLIAINTKDSSISGWPALGGDFGRTNKSS